MLNHNLEKLMILRENVAALRTIGSRGVFMVKIKSQEGRKSHRFQNAEVGREIFKTKQQNHITIGRSYTSDNMPRVYAVRRPEDEAHSDNIRAALAEFLSTFIFVFAGEGSVLALDKMYRDKGLGAASLVLIALAHALSLFAAVASAANISGGHVNPAVTFGVLVGGRISAMRAILYWIAQILGAVVASFLLRFSTDGMRPLGFEVATGVGNLNALLMEIVLTFGLVYTVFATAIDTNRGHVGTIAPLAIGLIVGANVLVGGPFSGASMNPARAFGPALVGWRWNNHWIYWLGPFIGAALSGLIYEFGAMESEALPRHAPVHHQPLAPEDY